MTPEGAGASVPGSAGARAAAIADLSLALAELTGDRARLEAVVVQRIGELVGDAAALWRQDDDGALYLAVSTTPTRPCAGTSPS